MSKTDGLTSANAKKVPKNDLVYIKKSPVAGLGVFASEDIPKGTKITDYLGEEMDWKTFKEKYGEYKSNSLNTYPMRYIHKIIVAKEEPYKSKNLVNYINEQRGNANCMLKTRALYAKKNIKKGDELFLEYPKDYNRYWEKKPEPLVGKGMNANLLKQFIDYSYLGNTSIAPEGYSIDAPLSDSRVKVYTKNGSNDKDVVVTHRGSVGADDWMDNARYALTGKVKGTKTYNLHRERHKKAVEKYGAKNIIAIGHSRAGLYIQELQKEFPIKENITYNKASGFHDIGRQNDPNQTDIRVGNDIVSLLAPLQKRPNQIVNISGTKNPLDLNTAHQSTEIDKLGTTFVGKKDEEELKGSGYGTKIGKKMDSANRKKIATKLKPITEEIAVNDYKDLDDETSIPPMTSNKGLKFVDYFTFVERLNTEGKRGINFYDFWENRDEYSKKNYFQSLFNYNKEKKNYETNLYDIFRLYFGSVNVFKPVIAMEIYNKYKPTSVLDLTMGWGGRLVGATIMDVPNYIGIDLNKKLEAPYKKMLNTIKKIGTKTKVKLMFKDALKVDYSKLDYDMVFTSPPYYNVETYSGTTKMTKEEWNDTFYKPLFTKSWNHLKVGGHYILNVPISVYESVLIPLLGKADTLIPLKLSARKNKKYISDKGEKEYKEYIYVWKKTKQQLLGEGIQPRISGTNQIRKLLGVEQRRLERLRKGTTKYKTSTITEPKTLEKISRLKKRLASAEANDGQATAEFFVPKTEKWLKINKNETYLNTPLKEDGKHKLMLTEIDKRIDELKAKKAKKTKNVVIVEPEKPIEEPLEVVEEIKQEIKQEINKAEEVLEAKVEEPKKKLTKEERKKAKLAKKKEYDRLRYLQIKAKKLEALAKAKTTETPKQVEKLEEKVEVFKEEVKEFVDDVKGSSSGSGFNKKQLRQIILDKNKVIADLEETAYGGNYDPHSYLDNILDSNTTSQNKIILSEKISNLSKYVKHLNLEI
jgi:hypothetical protein